METKEEKLNKNHGFKGKEVIEKGKWLDYKSFV